jgi:hypothetical protein
MFHHSISLSYFVFSYFLSSFFKILIYRSSAVFYMWFCPKRKSHETLDIVVSRKVLFWKFCFVVFVFFEAATHQPPLYMRLGLNDYFTIALIFHSWNLLLLLLSLLLLFHLFWSVYIYVFSIEPACTQKFWYKTWKFRNLQILISPLFIFWLPNSCTLMFAILMVQVW